MLATPSERKGLNALKSLKGLNKPKDLKPPEPKAAQNLARLSTPKTPARLPAFGRGVRPSDTYRNNTSGNQPSSRANRFSPALFHHDLPHVVPTLPNGPQQIKPRTQVVQHQGQFQLPLARTDQLSLGIVQCVLIQRLFAADGHFPA